ncbi:hypothetical protein [Roseofilum casamattae]|uniref:Uncharacterized protein n=1 Tax=Roseofilum casamattae BLCC-M143 TaxID=3022442 RepID=A0ABT7C2K8_9CYAN|nr:hypothetical protein [Roseofilum casamattae]MDJ1184911.1 hypothetical protein [Roseofilum casamattae BLCC-M143]
MAINSQILAAIKQMGNTERLQIVEFTLSLVREDRVNRERVSLEEAAQVMLPYYAEGSILSEFTDRDCGDFYEYQDYV